MLIDGVSNQQPAPTLPAQQPDPRCTRRPMPPSLTRRCQSRAARRPAAPSLDAEGAVGPPIGRLVAVVQLLQALEHPRVHLVHGGLACGVWGAPGVDGMGPLVLRVACRLLELCWLCSPRPTSHPDERSRSFSPLHTHPPSPSPGPGPQPQPPKLTSNSGLSRATWGTGTGGPLTMYSSAWRGTGRPHLPTRKPRAERSLRLVFWNDWGGGDWGVVGWWGGG